MKKTSVIIIAVLTAFSMLCACGEVNGTDGVPASSGSEESAVSTEAVSTTIKDAEERNETSAESNKNKPGLLKRLLGGKTGANGKEYREYNAYDEDRIIDGFNYHYEEGLTHTFIAYKNGDETWLFDPSEAYFSKIDPDGLCEVEAGKAYTLTYDVQHKTGGIAGVHESYLLNVDSCEPVEISSLFNEGIGYVGIWNGRQTRGEALSFAASGQKGSRFICVNTGDGYTLYQEDGSVLHFDENRQVAIPYDTVEETREEFKLPIGFSVLCNKGVTDEQIIGAITSGNLSENKDLFLIGSCSDGEKYSFAAECAGVDANTVPFYESETAPAEGFRKVITMAEFERGITAEEAGLPEDVFYIAETEWHSDKDYYGRFHDGEELYPYSRGILILGGDFTDSDMLYMDDNARFCVANRSSDGTHARDHHMNYAIISVRQEYLDLIPQG